jgi:glycosyltransferase involved in cell wall biosynthesis
MRIAYLIPEFPGQTHIMFWRERAELQRLGIATHLVSTRRPPNGTRSHHWSRAAEQETFYLTDIGLRDAQSIIGCALRLGPRAIFRALKGSAEGKSLNGLALDCAALVLAIRLIMYMRANNLTHVHSHSCAKAALVAMFANRLAGMTYSLTLHGDLADYGRKQRVKWRHAAFAITITSRLYRQVQQEIPNDLPPRIGLAPMGVDPELFVRRELYSPWEGAGTLRLFSCGRLNFVKGHQDLIKALSLLKQSGVCVRLEIAGEDEEGGRGFRKDLERLIADLQLADSVVLLGAVGEERVLHGLTAAHLFVLASHHEPLGVAIMEAMSCGTPVIATSLGGVPELVEHGRDGYLVPPKDPSTLAEAIRFMAGNPALARQFSAAGRAKIVERFNSSMSARELRRQLEAMA